MCREMKDSGVQWIGHIPREWNITKLKNLIIESNSGEVIDRSYWDLGDEILYSCSKETILSNYSNFPDEKRTVEGDLLLTRNATPYVFIPIQNSIYTNVVQRIKLKNNVNIKFVKYNLETSALSIKGVGDIIESFNMNVWGNSFCVLPNIIEQEVIVNYLDKKVSQIDDIISKQKSLIEKYKDYKQSIITETVTKGLNKNVPMKDSGIEWNREIPVHWNVIQSKNLFSQRKDRAKEGERQLTASQKYGVIYQDEYMKLENQKVVTVDKGADILKQVEPNDFVISMRSFQGGLEYSSLSGSISSAYVMLIPNKKVYPPYFRWLFKSIKYINALQSTSNLVRDGQAMRYSNFKQIPLFEIPIEEQQEIAEFLDNRCKSIDSVISKKEQLIEKLESYKKSLIYECVTGKRVVN